MTVLAIDPGCFQSAWVLFDGQRVLEHGIAANQDFLTRLSGYHGDWCAATLVIEQITSYGMAVGREVFETVWWSGRFYQTWVECGHPAHQMPRRDVKLHLCRSTLAKDANIRQALLDRFGGEKVAKGKKAAPGPLHGLRKDEWQALALAVTWWDQHTDLAQPRTLTAEVTP